MAPPYAYANPVAGSVSARFRRIVLEVTVMLPVPRLTDAATVGVVGTDGLVALHRGSEQPEVGVQGGDPAALRRRHAAGDHEVDQRDLLPVRLDGERGPRRLTVQRRRRVPVQGEALARDRERPVAGALDEDRGTARRGVDLVLEVPAGVAVHVDRRGGRRRRNRQDPRSKDRDQSGNGDRSTSASGHGASLQVRSSVGRARAPGQSAAGAIGQLAVRPAGAPR